jgi:hypothetical protein
MTGQYGGQIDFTDERFKYIPGDIHELLDEMDTMYSRMDKVARGEVEARDVIMELDFVRSRLTHLIDHSDSLREALFALMTHIDSVGG